MTQPLFSIKNEMTGEFQAPFYRKNEDVAKFEWSLFLKSKKSEENPTLKYQKLYRLPFLFDFESGEIIADTNIKCAFCLDLEDKKE